MFYAIGVAVAAHAPHPRKQIAIETTDLLTNVISFLQSGCKEEPSIVFSERIRIRRSRFQYFPFGGSLRVHRNNQNPLASRLRAEDGGHSSSCRLTSKRGIGLFQKGRFRLSMTSLLQLSYRTAPVPALPQDQVSRILETMDVQLTPDQQAFARRAIENGRLHSEKDAVQEALALWEERERQRTEFLLTLEDARASLSRGEGRVITRIPCGSLPRK
jgi:Arc/MetJ-type ribon-helix-helix transcriptional regulator